MKTAASVVSGPWSVAKASVRALVATDHGLPTADLLKR